MRSRLATIASVLVLVFVGVFVLALVGREALLPPDDNLLHVSDQGRRARCPADRGRHPHRARLIAVRAVPLDDTNSMAYTESSQVVGKAAAIDILELQLVTPNLLVEE